MKKQIISLLLVCVFFWANLLWAAPIPQPDNEEPETETSGPAAPASTDALKLGTKPVLSWTEDSVLAICVANCGATNASKLYAYYNGASFPAGTQSYNVKEDTSWYVLYKLPGSSWQRITNSMLGSQPAARTANIYADTNQTQNNGGYRVWTKNKKGKYEEMNLSNEDFAVLVVPNQWDQKGRPNNFTVVIKDRATGHVIIHVKNVKITHWGKTIRTLGIAAAITVGIGTVVFYAPGILLALPGTMLY